MDYARNYFCIFHAFSSSVNENKFFARNNRFQKFT